MAQRDQELKRYLMEMDVPLELWTIAHNTPSWGVSYLSDIRKRIYGLYTTLPAEQERRIAAYVRQTGESKQGNPPKESMRCFGLIPKRNKVSGMAARRGPPLCNLICLQCDYDADSKHR
jgi:hypothetical protein